ncbi:hypothetical protein AVEN_268789-1 [Araneus ventricosus]|uniref:Uncharacterized protein n=1 Tax=Araneus ventricosus TaxID=182803 RepID=A0A4Y2V6Y6_ARAVE|nr:hypothetical protein AVEN_55156-1 [Araneus ventricosus]GBO20184.1 hypothetical protein AVEN_268789-1 [Araneus ventricosus]
MTRTTPQLAAPYPNFRTTPTGRRFNLTYDLTYNKPTTRQIFSGIGFRTWNLDDTLPLGHRILLEFRNQKCFYQVTVTQREG